VRARDHLPILDPHFLSIGLDKGGLPGIAALGMALALSSPVSDSTMSTGRVLAIFVPVLSIADLGAVYKYSKTIEWDVLKQLSIPTLLGLLIGFYFIGSLRDDLIRVFAGSALLILSLLHIILPHLSSLQLTSTLPQFYNSKSTKSKKWRSSLQVWIFGLSIGSFTIISNIAGPIAVTYLIELGLQKNELNGTRSCLFLLINCIKIPCQIYLGNLQFEDLLMIQSLCLVALMVTFLTASYLMPIIQQGNFETITWVLVIVSAIKLIFQL
jgi:uncharacterized membrane protein YfcA